MTAEGPLAYLRENNEKVTLVAYFVVMVGLSVPLVGLFRRGWTGTRGGNITRTVIEAVSSLGVPLATLQAVAIGLALATSTLLVLDRRKRIQGVLLWFGLAGAGLGLLIQEFVLRVFIIGGSHWLGLLVGAGLGVAIGVPGETVRALSRFELPRDLTFPRASETLHRLTKLVVVLMWVEAHVVYPPVGQAVLGQLGGPMPLTSGLEPSYILLDAVVALGFITVTGRFTEYEAETSILVLGPKGAGKTSFLYGAFLECRSNHKPSADAPALDYSRDLQALVEEADPIAESIGSDVELGSWTIDSTSAGELNELWFAIERGSVFPKRLTVESLDYAGETLSELVDVIEGKDLDDVDTAPEHVISRLYARLEEADVLVFLVDVERFFDEDRRLETEDYTSIIREYHDEKQLLFAATKADHFDEEFQARQGKDPYDRSNLDELSQFVTDELVQRRAGVRSMLQQAGADTLHPVYFRTMEDDRGRRRPVVTDGRQDPFGFKRVLEQLE